MYGQIFEEVVGKSITEFSNLIEVEKAVEKAKGERLEVQSMSSPLVSRNGNVFPYKKGLFDDIEQKIDRLLKR